RAVPAGAGAAVYGPDGGGPGPGAVAAGADGAAAQAVPHERVVVRGAAGPGQHGGQLNCQPPAEGRGEGLPGGVGVHSFVDVWLRRGGEVGSLRQGAKCWCYLAVAGEIELSDLGEPRAEREPPDTIRCEVRPLQIKGRQVAQIAEQSEVDPAECRSLKDQVF